ncbi:MAG: hypothetical protein Q9217_000179 [Psora testacea]
MNRVGAQFGQDYSTWNPPVDGQVGTAPRSYAFVLDSTRAKRRKLQIEEVEAQTDSVDETSLDCNEDDTQPLDLAAIKAGGAVAHYRVLEPEEALETPLNLSSHLYKVGLWTECLGLVNVILQRLVRVHFTSLIDEGKDLLLDRSGQMAFQGGCAITKAIKATMVKIYPRMKGWDSSSNPAKRSAFLDVQRNLRRWRQEGAIWSLIQNKFSSLALLILVPHRIRVLSTTRSISGSSSFQTEIPRDARVLFVDALAELRPSLWSYVPKLANFFDVLSNPGKLKNRRFKIELVTDDDIRNTVPDSNLLVDAFEYSDISMTDMSTGPVVIPSLCDATPTLSQPSLAQPVLKETMIEASRLGLFDDILTYFYIKKYDFWADIQTNDPDFKPPEDVEGYISNSLNRIATLKPGRPATKDYIKVVLENVGLKGQEISELEQKTFHKHLTGYAKLWSPDCPIMVSTTNRYNVTAFEAAVVAKRDIRKGELLQHLCGILGEIKGAASPSAVSSTMIRTMKAEKSREYLLLGPVRFVNHDCKANAEFFTRDDSQEVIVRVLRAIEKGEEITVKYGKDCFAPDYASCLCGSCEIRSLGGWAVKGVAAAGLGKQYSSTNALRTRASDNLQEKIVNQPLPVLQRCMQKTKVEVGSALFETLWLSYQE